VNPNSSGMMQVVDERRGRIRNRFFGYLFEFLRATRRVEVNEPAVPGPLARKSLQRFRRYSMACNSALNALKRNSYRSAMSIRMPPSR
jgi:hypothetical protein